VESKKNKSRKAIKKSKVNSEAEIKIAKKVPNLSARNAKELIHTDSL
jgi:hypothetical protein